MNKKICTLFVFLFLFCLPLENVQASVEAPYPVEPIYPPLLERPIIRISLEGLPQGLSGTFPSYDGEPFHVNLPQKMVLEAEERATRGIIDQVLSSFEWRRDPNELIFISEVFLPPADTKYIEQQLKIGQEEMIKILSKKLGKLSNDTQQALDEFTEQQRVIALHEQRLFVYEQRFEGRRVEFSNVIAQWQQGYGLIAISGRVFNHIELENELSLSSGQAIEIAWKFIGRTSEPLEIRKPEPELVIYPFVKNFRYVWRMVVATPEGDYRLWLDADSGEVLELLPLFSSDGGQGLTFNPNPNAGTKVIQFEVDGPSGGNYQLLNTGKLDVNNLGADGISTSDLTITAGTTGFADFYTTPISGTVVRCVTDTNYNSQFQEINAYGTIYNAISLFEALGSEKFASLMVTVNDNNACSFGINNACSGGNRLEFGLGGATTTCSTSSNQFFNGANDSTVIIHELGHTLNRNQFSVGTIARTLHGSLDEGLADFWASTLYNTDTFGAWWGQNSPAPVQDGMVPRQAETLDVFPEHRRIGGNNAEIHADGQMVNWALWSTRSGLNNLSPLGTLTIDITLIKAESKAGAGVSSTTSDAGVFAAYFDLLQKLATEYKDSTSLYKVLSGFARAGITLSERDAIIDISDDWLAKSATGGPTFTVFTGRDFQLSGSNAVAANVFNTDYEVEVANDVSFTTNRVTSGNLTNVTVTPEGVPQGTWTLPAADWNNLKTGTRLYYRVTTRDQNGGNVRTSAKPGNSFFYESQPPAYAVINESGEYVCSCSPASGASPSDKVWAMVILVPLAAAFFIRQRSK